MGAVAYGWIGGSSVTAPPDPAEQAERAPSLVVSTAHSALGAVRRLQVRVGDVTVLLSPAGPGWVREAVADELDIGAHLAACLDLAGRDGEQGPDDRWSGTLPVSRYAAFRTAEPRACRHARPRRRLPGRAGAVAGRPGRARAGSRSCAGTARPAAPVPATVVTDELAWVDGGADGLWTVRPGGPDEVAIGRGTPAEVAAALAGMVRAAEGC